MFYEPMPSQVGDSGLMLEQEVSYLWADPGTGKTVTAMEAFRKGGFSKLVVLCPPIAVTMWQEELELHLQDHSALGNKKFSAFARRSTAIPKGVNVHWKDAVILPFGVTRRLMRSDDLRHRAFFKDFQLGGNTGSSRDNRRDTWEKRHKTALIIDEAHALKSATAQQTKAVFGNTFSPDCPTGVQYGMDATMLLTGTPVTRYFDDLWTQLRAGRAELLAYYGCYTYQDFVRMFCRTKLVKRGGKAVRVVAGNTNHKRLERLLLDAEVIRRSLGEVAPDMPPLTQRIVEIDYKSVPSRNLDKLSPDELLKLLNDPDSEAATIRRQLGFAKTKGASEYVREYGRKPYLIGYWHSDVGEELAANLGPNVRIVSGKTPTSERDRIRDQFNAGEIDGIIGQILAMSVSWNLQERSDHVMIAEEVPSPGMLQQFYQRVYRKGQRRHVQVDHLLSTHSLDVGIRNVRLRKQADNKRIGV